MLEGKTINLRVVEKEDLHLIAEWINTPEYIGEYNPLMQKSEAEMQKSYDNRPPESGNFFIEKKDGTRIGNIGHGPEGKAQELGYAILPNERKKGYCTEALTIMVDYLFLSKDIVRIQAHTDVRNRGSQKTLQKAGFKNEGIVRKVAFMRGAWRDCYLYSILREEWKEPKILTRTV